MKLGRPDYDDKIICVKSASKLRELLEGISTSDNPFDKERAIEALDQLNGHIPIDEPVMLFRGQDRYAPAAVRHHSYRLGSDKHPGVDVGPMVAAAVNHADAMEKWPVKKIPDMPVKAEE